MRYIVKEIEVGPQNTIAGKNSSSLEHPQLKLWKRSSWMTPEIRRA